jgi:hypothetical protein
MNFAKLTDDQVDDLRNMMESRGWDVFKAIIEEEKRVTSEGLYVRMDQRENDLDRGKMRTLRAIISLRDDVIAEVRERVKSRESKNDVALNQSMR